MIVAAAHGPIGLETRARTEIGTGMSAFTALLTRDIRLATRVGGGALMGALFFLIVVIMTPFAVGPDLALLARIGPGNSFGLERCWLVFWRSTGFLRPITTTVRSIS